MRHDKVVIALPSGDFMHVTSALSLASVYAWAPIEAQRQGHELEVIIHNRRGCILPQSRQELVEIAQTFSATHILFLDSDQTYPPDILNKLLDHRLPIVACNVATKSLPPAPTARSDNGTLTGEPVYTFPEVTGLEKVYRVGTGVMLISMHVFDSIEKPWFPITWDASVNKFTGEDWNFCALVQKAGYNIYVDHDLSKEIGHLGTMEFTHKMVTSAALHSGLVTSDKLDKSKLSDKGRLII